MSIVLELNDSRYLGSLCKRGHDWKHTGHSLRRKSKRGCIACEKCYALKDLINISINIKPVQPLSLEERFWQKVDKKSESECWEWIEYRTKKGYGQFSFNGKSVPSPRIAFMLSTGKSTADIKGLCICHVCDNPACCNPSHLFLGTKSENMQDKVSKGRQARGESNGQSTLTEKQVTAIYSEAASGGFHRAIARKYGISGSTVIAICQGTSWKHLGLIPLPKRSSFKR